MPDETPDGLDAEINELEDRLRAAQDGTNTQEHLQQAQEEIQKIDAGFEDRLKALEEKAQKHKTEREAKDVVKRKQMQSDGEAARGLGVGLTVAYTLFACTFLGFGLGWLLDRFTGGTSWKGLMTVAGMTLGVFMVVMITNRENNRS